MNNASLSRLSMKRSESGKEVGPAATRTAAVGEVLYLFASRSEQPTDMIILAVSRLPPGGFPKLLALSFRISRFSRQARENFSEFFLPTNIHTHIHTQSCQFLFATADAERYFDEIILSRAFKEFGLLNRLTSISVRSRRKIYSRFELTLHVRAKDDKL